MKIAYTGATGYIGQTFKRVYQKLDFVPISYDLKKEEYFSPNNRNILDIREILAPLEILIHLGSFTPKNIYQSQDKILSKKNIESTLNLISYNLPSLKHLIYISTIDVYDFAVKISEKTMPNPKSEYAISKLACEKILKKYAEERGILFSILRVGSVYGPGENSYQKVIPLMLKEFILNNQITIYGSGSARRNFIYVEDVARMIGEISIASKQNQIMNLTGVSPTSIQELAEIIQKLIPDSKAIIKQIDSNLPSSDHDFNTTLMNSNFSDFKFMPLVDGLYNEFTFIKSQLP